MRGFGVRGLIGTSALALAACVSGPASARFTEPAAASHSQLAPAAHVSKGEGHGHGKGNKIGSHFFGMWAPSLPTSYPHAPLGALNLSVNGVYWPNLETAPGVFDFSHLDALVSDAESYNAKPLVVLGITPSFYGSAHNAMPPLSAWKNYVSHV
ncbi:MAG TPA: hypothetical protein VHW64_16490, partial [Nocardioides sp.]|uniref:hypothetical protein n=1 Tax=Nocardioides sp. TaxID=35761 RepID=UPI002E366286